MSEIPCVSWLAKYRPGAVSRAALGCLLGAILLVVAPTARAADDSPSPSLESKIYRGILEGLGLKRDGEAAINYGERAPLVIPPGHDLPPPERTNAALTQNPAWPKDPDVARRKAEIEQERNRNVSDEREIEQNPLRPDQLTPGGPPKSARAARDDGYRSPDNGYDNPSPPDKLGTIGNIFSNMFGSKNDESARFTKEPPRAALTEPPPGYQTPSPNQPYGLSKATLTPKPKDYLETHGTVDGGSN
jgi:hypothetical protein